MDEAQLAAIEAFLQEGGRAEIACICPTFLVRERRDLSREYRGDSLEAGLIALTTGAPQFRDPSWRGLQMPLYGQASLYQDPESGQVVFERTHRETPLEPLRAPSFEQLRIDFIRYHHL